MRNTFVPVLPTNIGLSFVSSSLTCKTNQQHFLYGLLLLIRKLLDSALITYICVCLGHFRLPVWQTIYCDILASIRVSLRSKIMTLILLHTNWKTSKLKNFKFYIHFPLIFQEDNYSCFSWCLQIISIFSLSFHWSSIQSQICNRITLQWYIF